MNRTAALIIVLLTVTCVTVHGQQTNWSTCSNWKIYDIKDKKAFVYSTDTLKHFKAKALDSASIAYFLSDVDLWPVEQTSLWMGYHVLSCTDDLKMPRKIEVSYYGGFFYDDKNKRYYQVQEFKKSEWLEFMDKAR